MEHIMEEDWYTITGNIDASVGQAFFTYVNGQIYKTPIKRMKLMISSGGGDIDTAIRMYHYIKALPIEVETIGFSQIDSAANLIFLAGKTRVAIKGCRFFLHEGTFRITVPETALHVHEETLGVLKELLTRSINIIAQETGKKIEEIRSVLLESKILTDEEAKEYGIVHTIVDKLPLKKQTEA
jgi:ATP-dependent Clp protease protease subunit